MRDEARNEGLPMHVTFSVDTSDEEWVGYGEAGLAS